MALMDKNGEQETNVKHFFVFENDMVNCVLSDALTFCDTMDEHCYGKKELRSAHIFLALLIFRTASKSCSCGFMLYHVETPARYLDLKKKNCR